MSFATEKMKTTRPGSTDGLGRESGTASTVYDGKADVQEQRITRQTQGGAVYEVGQAQAFPPSSGPAKWFDQSEGDDVTITWPDGDTQAATIAEKPRRLDGRLVLAYT